MATIIVLIVLAVILFFLGRSFIRDRKNGGLSGRLPRLRRRQELPCEIIMPLSPRLRPGDFWIYGKSHKIVRVSGTLASCRLRRR